MRISRVVLIKRRRVQKRKMLWLVIHLSDHVIIPQKRFQLSRILIVLQEMELAVSESINENFQLRAKILVPF